ncbi:MAG: hypothetical protein G01um1014107_139 [Parcubacteria group bacterium Gr01-1014_107]|nr:MAG: hypothetical protein G01um1014107_139 [Parcubacteria group bacterium Gr01-1014_107]
MEDIHSDIEWFHLITRVVHLVGFAIGIGGATASDALFFKSLKDKKISPDELNLLKTLSKLMWVGFALLVVSGAGFLADAKTETGEIAVLSDPRFLAKLTVVGIIFLNGLIFYTLIIPLLSKKIGTILAKETLGSKIYLLAASGGISIVSWYSTFLLAILRGVKLPYLWWMSIYILLLIGAVAVGYLLLNRELLSADKTKPDNKI